MTIHFCVSYGWTDSGQRPTLDFSLINFPWILVNLKVNQFLSRCLNTVAKWFLFVSAYLHCRNEQFLQQPCSRLLIKEVSPIRLFSSAGELLFLSFKWSSRCKTVNVSFMHLFDSTILWNSVWAVTLKSWFLVYTKFFILM